MSLSESLPPAIADKPHRNLTGQVIKSPDGYVLGYGGLADVHKGEWTNPSTKKCTTVAIKLLRAVFENPSDWDKMSQRLNRETWVWDQLTHPNVLPFLGISNDAGGPGSSPALISPLCTHGDVLKYLQRKQDADRLKIVVGIAEGLRYLHSMGIIHGDMKGTNVLMGDNGDPLLCDFGRSRIIGHRGFTSRVLGTIAYQAPELIHARTQEEAATDIDADVDEEVHVDESPADKEIYSDKLTTKTDVYGYGMVALEILSGRSPYYYIRNDFMKAKRITEGEQLKRKMYKAQILTDARWSLLAECWAKDPEARPEIDQIIPRLV